MNITLTLFDSGELLSVDIEYIDDFKEQWREIGRDREALSTVVDLHSLKMRITVRESIAEIRTLIEKAKEGK